jgi:RNA polymerase sigma-70 factor (ECF subfamily)
VSRGYHLCHSLRNDVTLSYMASSALQFRPRGSVSGSSLGVEAPGKIVLDGSWSRANVSEMSGRPGSLDEREVLEGLQRGDGGVFDRLCVAYHDSLWRFAFGIVHSREKAQDVVQDVFLNIWERHAELHITTSLAAYLFSAVRRRAFVYLRNERTAARIAATWGPDDVPALGVAAESPLAKVEREEIEVMVARSLASLPPTRRQAVALRWREHMDYDEIAEAMGISSEAARAHVSRAYRTLRDVLRLMGVEPPA